LPRRIFVLGLVLALSLPVTLAVVNAGVSLATTNTFTARSFRGVVTRDSDVCDLASPGRAGCLAIRLDVRKANGAPLTKAQTSTAYGPADIRSAYRLTVSSSATVAVVDAYDAPTAEADLKVYRSHYGLKACTTANGCFSKVNSSGGKNYPRTDAGWAEETSLDIDMVSATCPTCHILLVEAKSNSFVDLAAAVQYAGSVRGVVAISNSYGGGDSSESSAYDQPGIAITASTGDNGYGVASPASYPHVIAVGGTTLKHASNPRGWSESAWSGGGSGCSTLNPKPTWQLAGTRCPGKANTDVSAVADPRTGVAVYDSTPSDGWVGWMTFGGTSASSPIIASVYALSRNTAGYPASHTWAHSAVGLNDLDSGNNGTCTTRVWCHSAPGWDGPTGLGTPIGISAF
jgi:subtilase family serine protease